MHPSPCPLPLLPAPCASQAFYQFFLGSPLKLWASIGHWWIWHFDLSKYSEAQVGLPLERPPQFKF